MKDPPAEGRRFIMYNRACVVSLRRTPSPSSSSRHPPTPTSPLSPAGSCCGILIDSQLGLVLAHASCLAVFLEQDHLDLASLTSTLKDDESLECEVLMQRGDKAKDRTGRERVLRNRVSISAQDVDGALEETGLDANHAENAVTDRSNIHRDADSLHSWGDAFREKNEKANRNRVIKKFPAKVVHFFQSLPLRESLQTLMPKHSWDLVDQRDDKTDDSKCDNNNNNNNNAKRKEQVERDAHELLSSFVILKLLDWLPYTCPITLRSARRCSVGERVEILSTPFGALATNVFLNSYSRGVLSNLAGKDNCLLLSDARCILGGEGAPLYTFHKTATGMVRYMTGVVLSSLCWKNQEWVGFCVAADIGAVLESAAPFIQHGHQGHSPSRSLSDATSLRGVPEVMLLQVGSSWGSGVMVDRDTGVVLTCSHVVRNAHLHPVEVHGSRTGGGVKGNVVYRQHPMRGQFDLAVLQTSTPPSSSPSSSPSSIVTEPEEGMEVFVVGYGLFEPEHQLPPSVTSGVISKVIKVNSVPVMVQTTCAVHPGASGGAVLDSRGRLVAIVVCNTRDNSTGASFPHVNLSVPACSVWPLIRRYLHTRDVTCLQRLWLNSRTVDDMWALTSLHDTGGSVKMSKL